jgi:hypothetical protein
MSANPKYLRTVGQQRSRSILVLLSLLVAVLLVGANPALAREKGYEWCSVDPLITLHREGRSLPKLVDVQVMIPLSQLPYKRTATLKMRTPPDVVGTVVLDTSHELYFRLNSLFDPTVRSTAKGRYPLILLLTVPTPQGVEPFPVQMMVTDPVSEQVLTFATGRSGERIRQVIWINE